MTREDAERMIEEMACRLGEHFEAVQIMASWTDHEGTACAKRGVGNWYARQGMAHEFINTDQAQETAHQLARVLNPPTPGDGDEWKE